MAPFYGWGSTVSRLEPLRGGSLLLPLSPQKFLIFTLSTSEGWKTESTLEPPVVLNTGPLDWESSTLTTRPLSLIKAEMKLVLRKTLWQWKKGIFLFLMKISVNNFHLLNLLLNKRMCMSVNEQGNDKL